MRKRILRPRTVVVTLSILISLIGGYAWLVRAAFTSAITVNVVYPPTSTGGSTVGGTGVQQVFRTGGPPSTAPFAGLDPGNPNPALRCPAGSTLTFLSSPGIMGPIGPNDFVYALQVSYDPGSTVRLDFVSNGTCAGRKITSVGYCVVPALENQNVAGGQFTPTQVILLSTGVDFVFDDIAGGVNHTVPPGRDTAVLFFTSPDPPSLQPASIQSSGVASNGTPPGSPPGVTTPPIYGPCPASLTIDKKIGCSPNGPFTDGPLTALAGSQVYYQITVKNTGKVPLTNLMVSDPQLGGDLTSQFNFPDVEVASGTLMPGLAPMGTPPPPGSSDDPTMRMIVVPFTAPSGPPLPGTPVTVVNTATAKGDYLIPKQDGTLNPGSVPSGPVQSVAVGPVTDSVTLNVVAPAILCDKKVNGVSLLTLPQNTAFPLVLNYTLKATNTGTTDLAVVIDDPKIKALKTAPPAGVTINMAIQGGAGFAAGSLAGGTNLQATFPVVPPSGMAQVNIAVTLANKAAFSALTDPGNPVTASNIMTAVGTVTNFTGCPPNANATTVDCFSDAAVVFQDCSISLTKAVACDTGTGINPPPPAGSFGSSVTALVNAGVVFRYVVTNTGTDTLNNVTITDNKITSPSFNVGTLTAGQSATIFVASTAPGTAGSVINTANVTANSQFAGCNVSAGPATATVNTVAPNIACSKQVNGGSSFTIPVDAVYPVALNYTLKATNTGTTSLSIVIDDPKLKALKTAPPAGVTINMAIQGGAGFAAGTLAGGTNLQATFATVPPAGMAQVNVTLTLASAAAFAAIADSGNALQSTNTMTAVGTVTSFTGCTTNATTVNCSSSAVVNLTPPEINQSCVIRECVGAACRGNDPGALPDPNAIVSDDKEGSVLFYNFYSSNIANPAAENTRIDLTNTAQGTVFVHLFFVDGSSCAIADSFVCLSGNQTTTLLASDMDPGVRGYVVAVAVDPNGCPIRWNFLIGDEYIKLASGFQANLGAEAFAAIAADPTGCNSATSEATLRFDGVSYNLAPRVLALDNFASNLDGNQTLLIINRVGGNLSSTAATIGGLFGILYDDLEKPFSFQFSAGCQFFGTLGGSFPRTTPRVDVVIPAGRSGWLKFWATADEGLLGAALVFNRGAGTNQSAYNQGHNLHKLRLTAAAQLLMPVFPPGTP